MKHRYLFILEITPVEVGKLYDELPSHLTLMSRFFSDLSPEQMSKAVKLLFGQTTPIDLIFGQSTELGPKKLTVHMIEHSSSLKQLHNQLRTLLGSVNVKYEYPQFIGENHKPHVTERTGVQFIVGERKTVRAAYLVEIVDGKRVICSRLVLSGNHTKQSSSSPMLVFISGSINSGKTTTSKLLAEKLGAALINVDDLNDTIPNFNLVTDLDKSMDLAIAKINECLAEGKDVVANYVVRQRDFDRFAKEINTKQQFVITLAPRLEVAQGKRGDRQLSEWEVARVKYHYDTGVASPAFGHIIDNSDISLGETVERIRRIIDR